MKNQQVMVIGLVVILGAVLFGFKSLGRGPVDEAPATEEVVVEESGAQTLLDLVALGSDVKCSFSYADEEGGKTDGEVYIAGGKARSNYTVSMPEAESFTGSTITDETYSYVWGSSMEGGMKMKLEDPGEVEESDEVPVKSEYVSPDQEMDYRCDPWSADLSVFTPPTDVEFRDLSAMMDDARVQQCEVCATLSGEAKTTCEEQLGC